MANPIQTQIETFFDQAVADLDHLEQAERDVLAELASRMSLLDEQIAAAQG